MNSAEAKLRTLASADSTMVADFGSGPFRWFQIQIWGPLAKFATTLKAGTPVIVEAKIKPETYTADGVEHNTFSIKADYIRKIDYSTPNEAGEGKAAKPARKAK